MATINLYASEQEIINDGWRFHLSGSEESALFSESAFDDSSWRELSVPHDWSIELPTSKDNPHENGWFAGGIGWYRRDLNLTKEDCEGHVELGFDGVYKHASLWINGHFVGTQYDGYTSFYYDITPYLNAEGGNTIALRVDNSLQPNCRWYTGSGIYRNVWIRRSDKLRIKTWGSAVTTPKVSRSEAEVEIITEVENLHEKINTFTLESHIFDSKGKRVASTSSRVTLTANNESTVKHSLKLLSPKLWSLESPELYRIEHRIATKDRVIDSYSSTFGVREIRFDAKTGFSLNGESMKFKGVCLHSDGGAVGAAVDRAIWLRRLTRLKELGCNAIRTAHNSMDPIFMDLCDSLGVLVMNEFVDKWDHKQYADPLFGSEWQQNFRQSVRRDRNHPSVVIWSVGNENYSPGTKEENEGLERYCNFVRSVDDTRPVISGMPRSPDGDPVEIGRAIRESTQYMDLIALNYGEQWLNYIYNGYPEKPYVSTESFPYYGSTELERWAFIERVPWFDVLENENNMGLFIWVGVSYLGEIPTKGFDSWPKSICWAASLLNTAGIRTPLSYFYESLWGSKPMIYLTTYKKDMEFNRRWGTPPTTESWNFTVGETLDMVSYTNCERVELYRGGQHIATQLLEDHTNRIIKWYDIEYTGEPIKAIGYNNGKCCCEYELVAAGEPSQLLLEADRSSLKAGETTLVDISLLDSAGTPISHLERELHFSIEGGEILALDNGALTALDSFTEQEQRMSHNGRCTALVKASSNKMKLTVTVVGEGSIEKSISL